MVGCCEGGVLAPTHRRPGTPTDLFPTIFGLTELIISASRAKNCEEVDFEVRFSPEAPKPAQKGEKRFPRPKNLAEKNKIRPKIELTGIV